MDKRDNEFDTDRRRERRLFKIDEISGNLRQFGDSRLGIVCVVNSSRLLSR